MGYVKFNTGVFFPISRRMGKENLLKTYAIYLLKLQFNSFTCQYIVVKLPKLLSSDNSFTEINSFMKKCVVL
ncbi:hypothetical protein ASE54_22930 [Bacillus sp. Root131]|nr:hypothetical protein ASE54_22930 [Bacillus sp. Root131]